MDQVMVLMRHPNEVRVSLPIKALHLGGPEVTRHSLQLSIPSVKVAPGNTVHDKVRSFAVAVT